MSEALALIAAHGPLILFLIILADQSGLPVPMEAFLLGAGALMAEGKLAPLPTAGSLLTAAFLGNLSWYLLGRRFGGRLLGFACRMALEPDSCVRRTENLFTRHGVKSLLVSKFVPGLDVLGPPLAGAFGVPAGRFIAFDLGGLAIWLGAYVGLGALAHNQLEAVAGWFARLGAGAFWIGGGALALYLGYKYARRVLVARRLRTSRITVEELKRLIDGGAAPVVVDLRHRLAARERPVVIPGAIVLSPDEVAARHLEIARDRDVVLYCA
jgi:membrane protein DedA with SNARE-associated domain